MCLISGKPEICSHQQCIAFYLELVLKSINSQQLQQSLQEARTTSINDYQTWMICSALESQNRTLEQIIEANKRCHASLDEMLNSLRVSARPQATPLCQEFVAEADYDPDKILTLLASNSTFEYTLDPQHTLPTSVFKERRFSLTLVLKEKHGYPTFLSSHPRFKAYLFTQDAPPRCLKLNIFSKKILRGTTETEIKEDGIIHFDSLVINEVSSHYTNGCFNLIIANLTSSCVKPFRIENLYVRARKIE
ncbi:unnamed protein product [Blepharisma stoltei]|uniref:Uncharacterized protein n=1 Tax=Blepharisma stoltei TaxID=1481888 RepID=A0AAU9KC60_9CILI|nr:unnamed protein product [Blepharisma stoltei]